MSITTNKVQSAITNYITIENTSENNTGTNKKRKTISGELPMPKQQNPNMTSNEDPPNIQ